MDTTRTIDNLFNNIEKVILGKREVVSQILKGILAGGHILLEDVPGVGKTTFVKALAKSMELSYSRIQFTPDLLPSDITGISIYDRRKAEFEFKKGPIFANVILADEINRTSPKTQSALLEVMEEHQVSEGNTTYPLTQPFLVLATQNPVEYEGTYHLPEAQLDRFIVRVRFGYPSRESEADILQTYGHSTPLETLKPVMTGRELVDLQALVHQVKVVKSVSLYITDICRNTRRNDFIRLGASTRASLALQRIAQATAFLHQRNYVIPEDVKENIDPVLSHRMILSEAAYGGNMTMEEIIENIVRKVPAPSVVYDNTVE